MRLITYLLGQVSRVLTVDGLVALAGVVALSGPASAGVLSGREFQNLIAGGPEGTTIVFQGGTDKIYYSPSLKNRLRQSAELGPEFLKQKILQNTVTEGIFIGAMIEDGKWRTISRHCRHRRRCRQRPRRADAAPDLSGGHQHQGIPEARPALCRRHRRGRVWRRRVPQITVGETVRA